MKKGLAITQCIFFVCFAALSLIIIQGLPFKIEESGEIETANLPEKGGKGERLNPHPKDDTTEEVQRREAIKSKVVKLNGSQLIMHKDVQSDNHKNKKQEPETALSTTVINYSEVQSINAHINELLSHANIVSYDPLVDESRDYFMKHFYNRDDSSGFGVGLLAFERNTEEGENCFNVSFLCLSEDESLDDCHDTIGKVYYPTENEAYRFEFYAKIPLNVQTQIAQIANNTRRYHVPTSHLDD